MTKAVSATEAKNRLGALIGWVVEEADEVIIERHGQPKVVLMSFAEYEKLQALKEQQRRQEALETLRRVQAEVSARNSDLTEEQADELADCFVRDVIDDLIAEGKIKYAGIPAERRYDARPL